MRKKDSLPLLAEMLIWSSALLVLFVIDPVTTPLTSICPLHNAGFSHCPGCGLGRSISFLFHGFIAESVQTHLLGIPAVIILLHRIVRLSLTVRRNYFSQLQRIS